MIGLRVARKLVINARKCARCEYHSECMTRVSILSSNIMTTRTRRMRDQFGKTHIVDDDPSVINPTDLLDGLKMVEVPVTFRSGGSRRVPIGRPSDRWSAGFGSRHKKG